MNFLKSVFWIFCVSWAWAATSSSLIRKSWTFVPIPAGEFTMGSPESEKGRDDESEAQVEVELSRDFQMLATEVTQSFYFHHMGANPSHFKNKKYCPSEHRIVDGVELCPNHPVESVFVARDSGFYRQSQSTQRHVHLPACPPKAEWEYAARAGTTTAWSFGDDAGDLGDYAWYKGNSKGQTHSVAHQKGQSLGPARHVRKRVGMGAGQIRRHFAGGTRPLANHSLAQSCGSRWWLGL